MVDYSPYQPLFDAAGQTYRLDPAILQAIARAEGGITDRGEPKTSPAGAVGIMQFMPQTAKGYGVDPTNPASSIFGAANYYRNLLQYYNGDIPSALAAYNGSEHDAGQTYAKGVLGHYKDIQAEIASRPSQDDAADKSSAAVPAASSGDQGGIKIVARPIDPNIPLSPAGELPPGVTRNFTTPAAAPSDYGRSDQPGSRAQHTLQASEYGTTAPADFTTQLFGKPQPATPAPAPAAPAAGPTAPASAADFQTQLFGAAPPPAAAVPPVAPAAAATPPAAPDVTIPSTAPLATPPQASWFQTNVARPWNAMLDPRLSSVTTPGATTNPMLQQPFLQNIGAGLFGQGPRNVAQTMNKWEQEADQNYPWLASLDRSVGETPEVLAARGQDLAAQTAAYRQQYGDSLEAAGGELAGNLLATYPLAAGAWGLRTLGSALPFLRGTTEVANMAGTPAAQNILTSPNKDWRTAGAEGAAGGLAVGAGLGSLAGQFARGVVPQAVQDARDLGFELSTGDERGGFAKQIEDYTRYLPGSGAEAKAAEYRSVINGVLNRNMGMPGSELNQATMQTARANAANLMNRIQTVTVDANNDPKLLTELGDIHAEAANRPMTGNTITGAVDKVFGEIANNGGALPGNVMHDLIKQGTPLDRLTNDKDPVIRQFAERVKDSLQDAASRTGDPSIYGVQQAAANQQAVDAFNQGRYYWKTIKTVEPLVDKTGTADDATYAALARRITGTTVNPNFGPRWTGADQDMQKLARVLNGPLRALPESGTGRQMITGRALGAIGGEGGLGAATAIFRPESFNTYLSTVVAPTLAAIGGGRILRYGSGMGLAPVEAANQLFNPLLPRALAPAVAGNPLLTGQPRQ